MKEETEIFSISLILILSSITIMLIFFNLGVRQQIFLLAILALAISFIALLHSLPEVIIKIKESEGWQLAILGTILWVVDLGIPYLLLKNTSKFWANYLFWIGLTSFVLILGIRKISRWKVE